MSRPMDENLYMEPTDVPDYSPYAHFQQHTPKPPLDIDPRLLSASSSTLSSPYPNHPDQNFNPYPHTSPFFDAVPIFEPLRHQMLGHRRSVSVPPEDMEEHTQQAPMVFHRGGHWLGDSTEGGGKGRRRQKRQVPYPVVLKERKGRRIGGPTSAPVGTGTGTGTYGGRDIGGVGIGVSFAALDDVVFGSGIMMGTAGMGILGFVERIQRDVDGLREFLSRGLGWGEEFETIRLEKRAFNHTVTSLDESLDILPLHAVSDTNIPSTGREIRDADGDVMDALLKAYDIPFEQESFVFEKKLVFLRFIGVSRLLMHAVLD